MVSEVEYVKIKFRLPSQDIFIFPYYNTSNKSQLLEELDIDFNDDNVIIDVLLDNDISIEKIEEMTSDYVQFIIFSHLVDKIKKDKSFWLEPDKKTQILKELKNYKEYNLDNELMEWLMIYEPREIKEFRIFLGFQNHLYYENPNPQNYLNYFLLSSSYTWSQLFIMCSKLGNVLIMDKIYQDFKHLKSMRFNKFHIELLIIQLAQNGKLDSMQWFALSPDFEDILFKNNLKVESLFRYSCIKGYIEMAQWLISLRVYKLNKERIQEHLYEALFDFHQLEFAQWLYSLYQFKIVYEDGINLDEIPPEIKEWIDMVNLEFELE